MDILAQAPFTAQFGKPGLAAGTTSTYTIGATFVGCVRGKSFSKSSASNVASPTTDIVTGAAFKSISANQGTVLVFMVDTGGTVKVAQGAIEALDVGGKFVNAPAFPSIPDGYCPFGYLVALGASTLSGTWLFGTNNLSSVTGMTYNFQDIATLPDRPQVA